MRRGLDLRESLFFNPAEVARLFGKPPAWAYRHAEGCLKPYARRLGRQLFFVRAGIEKLANSEDAS